MLMDWVKCLMEMEIANLQRTEFKDTLKFIMEKKKKLWLVHLAKILLQQLIIVFSSLYVYHVPVCMPDKVEVYSKCGF